MSRLIRYKCPKCGCKFRDGATPIECPVCGYKCKGFPIIGMGVKE